AATVDRHRGDDRPRAHDRGGDGGAGDWDHEPHVPPSATGVSILRAQVASTPVYVASLSPDESAPLRAVGVSHHNAPLEVRERLFLGDGDAIADRKSVV